MEFSEAHWEVGGILIIIILKNLFIGSVSFFLQQRLGITTFLINGSRGCN